MQIDYRSAIIVFRENLCSLTLMMIASVSPTQITLAENMDEKMLQPTIASLDSDEISKDYLGEGGQVGGNTLPSNHEQLSFGEQVSKILAKHHIVAELNHLDAESVPNSTALLLFPGDRSLVIELEDWQMLTPALLSELARSIVAHGNTWRIMFTGRLEQVVFCVYGDSVRFHPSTVRQALSETLNVVIKLQVDATDATVGEEGRQEQHARRAFAVFFKKQDIKPSIIALFDNWRGEKTSSIIWVFHQGSSYHDFTLQPEWDYLGTKFEIRKDGTFHKLYKLKPEELLGYLVKCVRDKPLSKNSDFKIGEVKAGDK